MAIYHNFEDSLIYAHTTSFNHIVPRWLGKASPIIKRYNHHNKVEHTTTKFIGYLFLQIEVSLLLTVQSDFIDKQKETDI